MAGRGESVYGERIVDGEIDELFAELSALSIEGPRAVGKTTTALQRSGVCFQLDDRDVFSVVAADPGRLVSESGTVVVDEWQRLPESWDVVRRSVDENPSAGRFLLTGSASPSVPSTHTGAGRIVSVRMRPLALAERWDAALFQMPTVSLAALLGGSRPDISGRTDAGLEDYTREIVRGGFPGLRSL